MSVSGSAILSGLAFLENCRVPDSGKPKTIAFDAVFNFEDKAGVAPGITVAYLTYYNSHNLVFSEEPKPYFIVAKIAKVENNPSPTNNNQTVTLSAPDSELTNMDYAFVGDIDIAFPASSESTTMLDLTIPKASITVAGVVDTASDYSGEVSHCTIMVSQFVSVYHKKFGPGFKATLPIRCIIKESARWTPTSKPRPRPGKVVSVTGSISEIVRNASGAVEYMEIMADQVSYLTDLPPTSAKLNNTLDPATPPSQKRKIKYRGFSSSPTTAPTQKKQKMTPLGADSSFSSVGSGSDDHDDQEAPVAPLTFIAPPKSSGPAAGVRSKVAKQA